MLFGFLMNRLRKIAVCFYIVPLGLVGCGDSQMAEPTGSEPDSMSLADDLDQDEPSGVDPLVDSAQVVRGPEGDSRLEVSERSFPLDAGLGDIWGTEQDHYNIDFTITNGSFLVTPTDIDGVMHSLLVPVQASAITLTMPQSVLILTTVVILKRAKPFR